MPDLVTVYGRGGVPFTVSKDYADKWTAFLNDPEWGDYTFNKSQSGGYNPRNIAGTNTPSQHAFGRAIDINWGTNARGTQGDINPELARRLATKHGLTWGGDWKNPDPMHFEIASGAPATTASIGGSASAPPSPGRSPMADPYTPSPDEMVTPEDVAARRKYGSMLLEQALSGGNPRTGWGALGNLALGLVGGGLYQDSARKAELAGQLASSRALQEALRSDNPQEALAKGLSTPYGRQMLAGTAEKILAGNIQERSAMGQAELAKAKAEAERAKYLPMQPGTSLINVVPPQQAPGAPAPRQPGVGEAIASQPLRPPPGYEPDPANPGQFRPMVGGPADIKFNEAKNKALFNVESSNAKADELINNINTLISHPGLKSNFGMRGMIPNIPGTQAADAAALLQQLKSQGGFLMLQQMREASKTGGALGNVSDAEGARLESAFGALQRTASPEAAVRELLKIKLIAQQARDRMSLAYARQYGSGIPARTPTTSQGVDISGMSLDQLRKLSPASLTDEQKKEAADRWDALVAAQKPSNGSGGSP